MTALQEQSSLKLLCPVHVSVTFTVSFPPTRYCQLFAVCYPGRGLTFSALSTGCSSVSARPRLTHQDTQLIWIHYFLLVIFHFTDLSCVHLSLISWPNCILTPTAHQHAFTLYHLSRYFSLSITPCYRCTCVPSTLFTRPYRWTSMPATAGLPTKQTVDRQLVCTRLM